MSNSALVKLPDSELEIMQAVWSLYEEGEKYISAGNIMKCFPEIARLKLTTVLTLITRLQSKGFIVIDKIGRSNCCKPVITRKDYQVFATRDFIDKVFMGDAEKFRSEFESFKLE